MRSGSGVNETQVCIDVLKSEPLDVILLAGRWTLLDRDAETELVGLARDRGTSLVLGGIYNSGILAKGRGAGGVVQLPAGERGHPGAGAGARGAGQGRRRERCRRRRCSSP